MGVECAVQVVTWFWEVVHGFSEEQKKRLLFFVTGSDRVPIKGLASLQPPFVIARNGPSSNRLPTAHTCFNHLLLPAYNVRPLQYLAAFCMPPANNLPGLLQVAVTLEYETDVNGTYTATVSWYIIHGSVCTITTF